MSHHHVLTAKSRLSCYLIPLLIKKVNRLNINFCKERPEQLLRKLFTICYKIWQDIYRIVSKPRVNAHWGDIF
jgi:hypothetical protein